MEALTTVGGNDGTGSSIGSKRGYVGIGTTNPTSKLDVNGDVNIGTMNTAN